MSGHGGKAVDTAPAGVKLSTLLSKEIKVDNKSEETNITGVVKNEGSKASGAIRLLVVGFDGMTVKNVEGCSAIPEGIFPTARTVASHARSTIWRPESRRPMRSTPRTT